MRKLIIITLATFLGTVLLFANPYNPGKNSSFHGFTTDTVSNPKIIGGGTTFCQQKSCINVQLKKIEAFEPQSYMIMYKINKSLFALERKESRLKEILRTYNPREISIMNGGISINNVKYNVKHLVILQ